MIPGHHYRFLFVSTVSSSTVCSRICASQSDRMSGVQAQRFPEWANEYVSTGKAATIHRKYNINLLPKLFHAIVLVLLDTLNPSLFLLSPSHPFHPRLRSCRLLYSRL